MLTFSEENHLKTIFHLEVRFPRGVSTNSLAEEMDSKASSVTEMLKKLSEKKTVLYRPYQGVKLNTKGKKIALEVIRKHRLWEYFLVQKLNFSWDEVHEVAEQLEHIKSEKLIYELDRYLDYPKKDPHGDPIPDADGNLIETTGTMLYEILPGQSCICMGVKDTSPAFLQYLDKNSIALGTLMVVIEKEDFDHSLKIKIGEAILVLSEVTAHNLYVKPII